MATPNYDPYGARRGTPRVESPRPRRRPQRRNNKPADPYGTSAGGNSNNDPYGARPGTPRVESPRPQQRPQRVNNNSNNDPYGVRTRPRTPGSTSRAPVLPSDYAEQERRARAKAAESTPASAPKPQPTPPRTSAAEARQQVSAPQGRSAPAPRASSTPSRSSAPAPAQRSTETPAPQASSTPRSGESPAMAEWRARFPSLAAALDKKNETRGTSKTDNPLIDAAMKARMKQREDAQNTKTETPAPQSPVGPVKDGADYASKIETKGTGPVKDGADYAGKIETKGTGPVKDGNEYAGKVGTKGSNRPFDKAGELFGIKALTGNDGIGALKITQRPFSTGKTLAELALERRKRQAAGK